MKTMNVKVINKTQSETRNAVLHMDSGIIEFDCEKGELSHISGLQDRDFTVLKRVEEVKEEAPELEEPVIETPAAELEAIPEVPAFPKAKVAVAPAKRSYTKRKK